ncbi:hypothetical protein Agabi119p4_10184 [Agaricus bisporus var. burnettii]|uniref:Uncharacterized protein n=1 Tax=Agaricus bisporus var. burnettii TaxID=192524 RepID=A0A8H7C2F5_AGABI|nr:hypothetical protein Agabi119p4_10184 [Agaricus bisporus var. burnettii]
MSDIFNQDFERHYRIPGVEPPQTPTVTFSDQRWDPLRRPPARRADDEAIPDVLEMALTEMPLVPAFSLAFPLPRAVFSECCARWAQKLRGAYEKLENWARAVKRSVTACLIASKTSLCNAVRGACDATMRVIGPLLGAAGEIDFRRAFVCVALD